MISDILPYSYVVRTGIHYLLKQHITRHSYVPVTFGLRAVVTCCLFVIIQHINSKVYRNYIYFVKQSNF